MENYFRHKSKLQIFYMACFTVVFLMFVNKKLEKSSRFQGRTLWKPVTSRDRSVLYDRRKLEKQVQAHLRKATERKIILIWYGAFGEVRPFVVDENKCGNCEITYEKSMIDDPQTGAVLFHFSAMNSHTMPRRRNPDQLHIFWTMESPSSLLRVYNKNLFYEDKYGFNATMTYRTDSDYYVVYGEPQSKLPFLKGELNSNLANILKLKTKTALTLVSNCFMSPWANRRLSLLKEIMDLGFPLEGRGGCFPGSEPLPKDENFPKILKNYKFYFAFENALHCRDYITEKFFSSALEASAIPVVWGATKEDYEAVAPPNSLIFVEDFKTSRDLVDYLNFLDKNDEEYLKYFKWYELKDEDMKFYGRQKDFCQICRSLHGINVDDIYNPTFNASNPTRPLFTNQVSKRSVSLKDWFYGTEHPDCMRDSYSIITGHVN